MIFKETELEGAFLIELERIEDNRGFFARSWCKKEFEAHGLNHDLVQSNVSFNHRKGTLRGLHYQVAPYQETKLVRCTRGAIFDVIIDLRTHSPTRNQWIGVKLTDENDTMLYVPEGFAHGYQTLKDNTEVAYHTSQFYAPDAERGIRWDDPSVKIEWPETDERIISDKDLLWPTLP
jgi:dTDP-4-dehydrorhamnose 3,5-epimerase